MWMLPQPPRWNKGLRPQLHAFIRTQQGGKDRKTIYRSLCGTIVIHRDPDSPMPNHVELGPKVCPRCREKNG